MNPPAVEIECDEDLDLPGRPRILALGHLLSLTESDCFRGRASWRSHRGLTLETAGHAKTLEGHDRACHKTGALRRYKVQENKPGRFNIIDSPAVGADRTARDPV
jgi:hypothetical protein